MYVRGAVFAGLVLAIAAGVGAAWYAASASSPVEVEDPWSKMPVRPSHVDHAKLISAEIASGPEATKVCLSCHPEAAREVMANDHWTWISQTVELPGSGRQISIGKRNLINNFCLAAGPNIEHCSACHAGYGWKDNHFDFTKEENVDCLVCHDQTNTYQKGLAGLPVEGVDLTAVAKSVGYPTRLNCGQCHFKGGGGDAVKHGDMDGSLYFPPERLDVHMGRHDFQCIDCHRTEHHQIPGCAMSVAMDRPLRVRCIDCHNRRPHNDERLDAHTRSVACQTCHIPRYALDYPTKMYWDWSQAGQDGRTEEPHTYLKKKGSFRYAQDVVPEYYWYNGKAYRYLPGERIDPSRVVSINRPLGGPDDPEAKIWPFKVHRGKQIYDREYLHLLAPRTSGEGGYWHTFDWVQACRLGAQDMGIPFSGQYGFVATEMYWPLSHMVQPKEKALQCRDCHGPGGRMDWQSLGFAGDPAFRGDRQLMGLLRTRQEASR